MASLTRDSLAARMLQRGTLPAWELLGKVAKAAPSLWSPSMSSVPSSARADQVIPSHNNKDNKAACSPGAPHNRKPRSADSEPAETADRTSASSSSIAGFRQHLRASLSGLSSVFRSPSKRKVGKQRPSHLPTIAASPVVVSTPSTAKKLPPPVSTPAESQPPETFCVPRKQPKQAKEVFAKSRPIKPRHRKVGKQRPSYLAPVGDIMKLPRPLGANPGTAKDPGPVSQRRESEEDRRVAETQRTQTQAKAESCAPGVPGVSLELRPEASDAEARPNVVKAKDQLWGQLAEEVMVRSPCFEGQPQPSPAVCRTAAPSSLSPKKPRTSSGKKRSLDQVAEVPKPPVTSSDLPQPTRGLSSIAAKQHMTKHHRPITKRVKLEHPKLDEDNYEISDLEEDLHGNRVEPDRSRKRVPAWCINYVQTAEMQAEVDPDSIFGSHMPICDLEVIFPDSFYRGATPIKRRRGSSCNWYRDGLTQREVNAYALKMGQKRSWSTAKSSFTLASSRISKADIPLPPVLAKVKVEAAPAKPTSCDQ